MFLLALAGGALGCGESSPAPDGSMPDGGVDGGGDAGPEVGPPSSDVCDRVTPGVAGDDAAFDVGLSRLHASVRLFRMDGTYSTTDEALTAAIGDRDDWRGDGVLDNYAAALEDVCTPVGASAQPGRPVQVEGDAVVYVRPGSGAVEVPATATAVVVDLRDLRGSEASWDSLHAAVGPALESDVVRPRHVIRRHDGYRDEVFSELNVYRSGGGFVDPDPIPGTGRALPIFLLTGERMPPSAAELAITLRLAGRAHIIGHDVLSAVAEMHWAAMGARGVAFRAAELISRSTLDRIPDVIPADLSEWGDSRHAAEQWSLTSPAEPPALDQAAMSNDRAAFNHIDTFADVQSDTLDVATMRAALLVAHGILRRFFPYFDVTRDVIDERLVESLDGLGDEDTSDRLAMQRVLRRFLEALEDGHGVVYETVGAEPSDPDLPVLLPTTMEFIDDALIVLTSSDGRIVPGDEILSIGGRSVVELRAEYEGEVSAASQGYRDELIVRRMTGATVPTTLVVANEAGDVTLTVDPIDGAAYLELAAHALGSRSRFLTDLGASDVYYLNLDSRYMAVDAFNEQVLDRLDDATGARAMVVDMRGYPGQSVFAGSYEVLRRLVGATFSSPRFTIPTWYGPDAFAGEDGSFSLSAGMPAYSGDIVWLVGPHSVSAAEHVTQMMVGAERVTVVGRPTAATNGNISGIELPGRLGITFTSMRVENVDGSRFHGIGIVPDVVAAPTVTSLREGRDAVLERAVAEIAP
ncbi:MAG: hypothetical protein JRH11_12145 [Deltaproteobacteria bacterium]|nr:hypothetical protein [Deltaproteobacteria bacterium]